MPKRNGRLQLCTKWEKVAIRLLLIAVAVALVSLMGGCPIRRFWGYILPWLRYDTGVCRTAAAGFPDSGSVSSIGFCADPRASLRCVPGVSALLTESEGRNGAFSGVFGCLSGRILLPDVDLPCRRAGNGLFKLRFL